MEQGFGETVMGKLENGIRTMIPTVDYIRILPELVLECHSA